jgi:branched-chain amino acid transport system ATP-binding protein
MSRLDGRGITRRYGGLIAVQDVDVTVDAGHITALIGPNGAGKTTLFNCLSGVEPVSAGRVLLDGRDVTRLGSDARATLGIGRTFQRLAVFPSLTVAENLLVGAESRTGGGIARGVLGLPEPGAGRHRQQVRAVLDQLGLTDVADQPAAVLPTGTLRLVELGRALCRDPRVLLLDEPASGLDPTEVAGLQHVLTGLASRGLALLLVEHDVRLVFDVAERVYVMAEGAVIAGGTPAEILGNPEVQAAYLDVQHSA